jgi:diguanylate cyclase (GGDEF)-like protein/PAS domain S-box-containing protein
MTTGPTFDDDGHLVLPATAAFMLLEQMGTAVAVIHANGRGEYANPALLALLDTSMVELTSVDFHHLVHFDDPGCPLCQGEPCRLAQALRQPSVEPSRFETVICRRNGPPLIVECLTGVLKTKDGFLTALELRDITQERQQAMAEQRVELAYRFAAEASTVGSWQRDWRHDTVTICAVMARMLGLQRERTVLSDQEWRALIFAEDMPKVEADLERQIAVNDKFVVEYRVRPPGQEIKWLRSYGSVVRDSQGQLMSLTGMSVDITDTKLVEEELRESEARYRLLSEMSPAGILVVKDDRFVYANDTAASMLGMDKPQDLLQKNWRDVIVPRHHDHVLARFDHLSAHDRTPVTELEMRRSDGSTIWVQSSTAGISWAGEDAVQVVARDVTEERKLREEFRILNERFNLALESVGEAVWDWDIASQRYTLAGGLKSLFGWADSADKQISIDWQTVVHPDDLHRVQSAMQNCLDNTVPAYQCEFRLRAHDGGWRWVLSRGIVVARDSTGKPLAMTGTVTDITSRKEADKISWRHANLDPLTGLPNRRLYRERLDHEMRKSQRTGHPIALLFIDLDRFKQVNDWLGHAAGDRLLVEAAQRICQTVRQSDTVARLGGDEFNVLLTELDHTHHVEFICQKILDALSLPFQLGADTAQISGSIGVAIYPDDADNAEELVRKADQAMYVAKQAGRQQFAYFTQALDETAHRRMQITTELRRALEAPGQLEIHFQPIVCLSNGAITKAEALIRWHHPWLGEISPTVFIPLAEEAGLIGNIGDWVLDQAAEQSRRWHTQLGVIVQISVNQSPLQFAMRQARPDRLIDLAGKGQLGSNIAIEITEGVLLNDSPQVKERLLYYRDAGIQVAIDDFGTGYSSMAYLQRFDIDYLKIDQSFVRDIDSNSANRTIAETIIMMAHKLGMKVIAEGIETEAQRACLADAGCDYGQGFLFSPAVPVSAFERMLSAGGVLRH